MLYAFDVDHKIGNVHIYKIQHLKENIRNFQKLKKHEYLIKYYIIQKRSIKYFKSSGVIVVKKKCLLRDY